MSVNVYRAFGLTVASCLHLPELRPGTGAADVAVSYGDVAHVPDTQYSRGVRYHATPGQFLMQADGIGRFLVRHGRDIVIDRHPNAVDDDVRLFLLGSTFGALLQQRGNLVLHGSMVKVGDECVVILGHSGVGKSTLAAVLSRKGYQCLSDDVCAISIGDDGVAHAAPAYPQAKLWVDTLQRFGIDETRLRRVRPSRPKRAVPLEGPWDHAPLPVARLYVLNPGWLKLDPILQPIVGSARFRVLRDYTYRAEFIRGLGLSKHHFKQLAHIATRLPVTRVVRGTDAFLVEEFARAIEDDLGVGATRAARMDPVDYELEQLS